MSDITMVTYPLIVFLFSIFVIAKFKSTIPMWLSFAVYTLCVAVFSYWFLFISILELRPIAFVAYTFYFALSFVVFYLFSKTQTPIVTFTASFLFLYAFLRYWEVPAFIDTPVLATPQLLLWCLFGLTLLWLTVKPKKERIVWLLIGLGTLSLMHISFYYSDVSVIVERAGSETYYMISRIIGAYFMYRTFIRGAKNKNE